MNAEQLEFLSVWKTTAARGSWIFHVNKILNVNCFFILLQQKSL